MNKKITGFADEIDGALSVQVKSLKELGMSYVEMRGVDGDNLIFHSNDKVKEIKRVLDDNGIRISALGSPLGKIGITDTFEPHFEAYKRAVEIAHMMECRNIRMFSFYIPKDSSLAAYEGEVMDRLGQFVDYAKGNDVLLLHENEKGIYGEKAPECVKLMETFYGDNFRAIFDFANFVQCDQDTLEAYTALKPYISYIHVKDALKKDGNVVPAGYGDGNVEAILKDLYASGFDGFLSLEPHLSNFAGFASLEKDGKSIDLEKGQKLTGREAFNLAHDSLFKILNRL